MALFSPFHSMPPLACWSEFTETSEEEKQRLTVSSSSPNQSHSQSMGSASASQTSPVDGVTTQSSQNQSSGSAPIGPPVEIWSRKVFVGGLPLDVGDNDIRTIFTKYGPVFVDWPRRSGGPDGNFSPRGGKTAGYVFLVYEFESSVRSLVKECYDDGGEKLYLLISSSTIIKKPVQIRPWRLSDADFLLDPNADLDPRKTVFIGGVPRPLKAKELANVLQDLYGDVCYVGIDTDPELKYPKGAARVSFSSHKAFIASIDGKFVQIKHSEAQKRVEVKPYVMDDQMCDECYGNNCNGKYASFFCPDVQCLQYYCEKCWLSMHSQTPDRQKHRPMAKLGEAGKRVIRHFENRIGGGLSTDFSSMQMGTNNGGGAVRGGQGYGYQQQLPQYQNHILSPPPPPPQQSLSTQNSIISSSSIIQNRGISFHGTPGPANNNNRQYLYNYSSINNNNGSNNFCGTTNYYQQQPGPIGGEARYYGINGNGANNNNNTSNKGGNLMMTPPYGNNGKFMNGGGGGTGHRF